VRTTLTIDDDVAAGLREEMRRSGVSFKIALNTVLRRGLEAPREEDLATPFRVEARDLGLRAGNRLDDISGLLDALDGASCR
jgi:ribosomal protein L10